MYGSYGYGGDPFEMVGEIFGTIMGALGGALFFVIFIMLACGAVYVLQALGLKKMAENRGEKLSWLAWLPLINFYLIGNMVGPITISKYHIKKTGVFMGFLMMSILNVYVYGACLATILMAIPVLGWIVGGLLGIVISFYPTAVTIMMYVVYYKLFKQYAPDKATMFLILTILFGGVPLAIFFFMHKDSAPVELPELDPEDYPGMRMN